MSLIHGKAIEAEEIERVVSRQFSPERFASLCNALTWASSGQQCTSLVSFTERVNVADGGIDAELTIEIESSVRSQSLLRGNGWNISQYKQRDVTARDRDAIFSGLKGSVKGALREVWERTNRRPDVYVFFTNLDLTHLTEADRAGNPQKGQLRDAILEGYDRPENVHIEITGAAELAAMLNSHPHLRSAYFATSEFETWQRFSARHFNQRQNVFGPKVNVLGRDPLLAHLRALIDSSTTKIIVIYGPHTIGKTRLAIEATSHRPVETVVALDPLAMTLTDLAALALTGVEIDVIIEGPDSAIAERLIEYAISVDGIKLIITLPTSEKAPQVNYGGDARIQMIPVGPLNDENAEELLKAAGAKIDYSLQSWVVQQAGGNPGILLMAANLGNELRHTAAEFVNQVSTSFEQRIRGQLGDKALEMLGLLSLLTHVGIRGKAVSELNAICTIFGRGTDANSVLNFVPRLQGAGIVSVGGSYVEVVPPIFANALAATTLNGRFAELCTLLAVLGRDGAIRLLRRVRSLRTDEVERFWDELFGKTGFFKDFDAALVSGYLLRLIAGSVPNRVARLIGPALNDMSIEQRQAIKNDQRRELVWAVEELLYRRQTSADGMRCVLLLAEAESESGISNNATGVFADCFHSWHPQFPMALAERLAFLKSLLSPNQPMRRKLLAIIAASTGLGRMGSTPMHNSDGPEPLDSAPLITNGDVWDYTAGLVEIILNAGDSNEPELSRIAIDKLPQALMDCAAQTRPRETVTFLTRAVDLLVTKKLLISITALTRSIKSFEEDLLEWGKVVQGDQAREVNEYLEKTRQMLDRLENGDFGTRLKKWVGGWSHDLEKFEIDDGRQKSSVYRDEKQIFELAEEVIQEPRKLSEELIDWLTNPDAAQGRTFFYWLGVLDRERRWQERIESIGALKSGANIFSAYFGGIGRYAVAFTSKRLDELTAAGSVAAQAILFATTMLPAGAVAIGRVESLIHQRKVDPSLVARVCATGWLRDLSPPEFLRLVKAIAGGDFENAGSVIDLFAMWIHCEKALEGELAEYGWQCLESAPPVSPNDSYDCNIISTVLAKSDIDRAFGLLDKLLRQPYEKQSWNPVDRFGTKDFWEYLHSKDRQRLLITVLTYGLEDRSSLVDVSWHLNEALDQEKDQDLLVEFANRGEKEASLVARSTTASKPGFWPIAFSIVQRYGENEAIEQELMWSVDPMKNGIVGSYALHIDSRREEVQQLLTEAKITGAACAWLVRVEDWLRKKSKYEAIAETDERTNDLRRGQRDDPGSPERIWAVESLVRQGKFEQLKGLFEKLELLKLLPSLRLAEDQMNEVKRMVDTW